jgi:uncharacterized membrane protein YeaQ/YmgE (transglycosylase-associated protein family)
MGKERNDRHLPTPNPALNFVNLPDQIKSLPSHQAIHSIEIMGSLLWTLIIGLVVGAIAKLLMPGKDPGGFIITILLGIAGAFVGTWIGRLIWGSNYLAGWILSILGAMLLLFIYRMIASKRT